jgi:hypothetical protein
MVYSVGRLAKLEKDCSSNPSITPEKAKYLEDTALDLQCRSMKNNLIFTGLGHSHNEEGHQLSLMQM